MDTSEIAATGFFFRPMTNVFPTCSRRSAGGPAERSRRAVPSGIRAGASTCAETGVRTVIFCSGMRVVLTVVAVSYTHLRAHETPEHLVCRLLLEKKKK